MENKWKPIAIIFIVLFLSLAVFNIWLFYIGSKEIARENECFSTCEGYYTSSYNPDTRRCYCFDEDYEIVKEQLIK